MKPSCPSRRHCGSPADRERSETSKACRVSFTAAKSIAGITLILSRINGLSSCGNVKTLWKYEQGSTFAFLSFTHFSFTRVWHFGQWLYPKGRLRAPGRSCMHSAQYRRIHSQHHGLFLAGSQTTRFCDAGNIVEWGLLKSLSIIMVYLNY